MKISALILGALIAFGTAGQAEAAIITYVASMSGANENPSNASTATGFTTAVLDTGLNTLTVDVIFNGLSGNSSAAHIHCCVIPNGNAIVAVPFVGFPPVPSGTYHAVFDLALNSTYNGAFLTVGGGTAAGAKAVLIAGLAAGQAYSNIHNSAFTGGEIRGFLAIPEPVTLSVFGAGLLGAVALRRRRKTK